MMIVHIDFKGSNKYMEECRISDSDYSILRMTSQINSMICLKTRKTQTDGLQPRFSFTN